MEPPALPAGRRLDLPGRGRTFVRELAGPPGAPSLLLLHGWTANSDLNWFTSFGALSRHFAVVAMDHRGHGRGIRSRRRFRLEDCADDAHALIETLGSRPGGWIAVGYSMGGSVAQLLWRRHRRSLSGLVLCATAPVFAESPGERRYFAGLGALALGARATPGPLRRRLAQEVLGRRGGTDCSLQAWIAEELHRNEWRAVLEAGRALGRFDSRPWLGEVDVPTAVVATLGDRQVLPGRQVALAGAIPGASVHRVDGGHDVCVTGPERFIPPLVAACRSVAARAAAQSPVTAGSETAAMRSSPPSATNDEPVT